MAATGFMSMIPPLPESTTLLDVNAHVAATNASDKALEEAEAQLLLTIDKYEVMITLLRDSTSDFANTSDITHVLFHQAECMLVLARTKRFLHRQLLHEGHFKAREDIKIWLDKAKSIYSLPDLSNTKTSIQGEILIRIEWGQVLALSPSTLQDAMTLWQDTLLLCRANNDETNEALLIKAMENYQMDIESTNLLNKLTMDPKENHEKELLFQAFQSKANSRGLLLKSQLKEFAIQVGTIPSLSEKEVEEMWKQLVRTKNTLEAFSSTPQEKMIHQQYNTVTFDILWRWWISDQIFEFQTNKKRPHRK